MLIDRDALRYELTRPRARRYLFRGQWVTIAEAVELSGLCLPAVRARVRGDVIEDLPRQLGGTEPRRYHFRGQHLTLREIADMVGEHRLTVRKRISGDRVLEADEVKAIPRERSAAECLITFRGATHNLNEWAAITGLSASCIGQRLIAGWSIVRTLTTPSLRVVRTFVFEGEELPAPEVARRLGLPPSLVRNRLFEGWSLERALTTPVAHKRKTIIRRMVTAFRRARNAHAIARMVAAFAVPTATAPAPARGVSETFPNVKGTGGRSRKIDFDRQY